MATTVTDLDLNRRQKAAIVIMSLGEDASEILKALEGAEVERIAEEIVRLGDVEESMRDRVLTEFHNHLSAAQAKVEGGLDRAAEVLEATFGKQRADQAVRRMEWKQNKKLIDFVRKDPAAFAEMIATEHPQTIAFLLTQVDVETSAQVIAHVAEEERSGIALRIATMREISPDDAGLVHTALNPLIAPEEGETRKETIGGEDKVAGLLNMVSMDDQKSVLDTIEEVDAEIAKRIRKLMFVFRDILLIDDRSMQRILKEVEQKDLGFALKKADRDVQEKFFKNMSERAAQTIQEEMEYMANLKDEEAEEAQDRIIERIRALEEQGEVVIDRTVGRN